MWLDTPIRAVLEWLRAGEVIRQTMSLDRNRRESVMTLTRQVAAQKLVAYLHHDITAAQLVDWAEMTMMDEEFDEEHCELLRDIISRIGLADVRAFGLTWEDCEDILSRLGYKVSVTVAETPVAQC